MTFSPKIKENDIPKRSRVGWWSKYWWIVLLVVCLIGVGTYLFVQNAKSRAAKQGQRPAAPAVPVVAVPAKKADFNM